MSRKSRGLEIPDDDVPRDGVFESDASPGETAWAVLDRRGHRVARLELLNTDLSDATRDRVMSFLRGLLADHERTTSVRILPALLLLIG